MFPRRAIDELPAEILSIIFRFSGRPFTSSHVCKRWRHVALEVSPLWKDILLLIPERDRLLGDIGSRSTVARLLEQRRLQRLAISYTATLQDDGGSLGGEVNPSWISDVLVSLSDKTKLESLELDRVPLRELSSLANGALANLQSLTLMISRAQSHKKDPGARLSQNLGVLSAMPNLRTLRLNRQALEYIGRNHSKIPLRWSQLTHLEDLGLGCEKRTKNYKSYSSFLQHCLPLCTNLESLKLSVQWTDYGEYMIYQQGSTSTVTTLNSLETLTLEYQQHKNSSVKEVTFLVAFRFPNLKKLAIVAPDVIGKGPVLGAMGLRPHLQRLTNLECLHLDIVHLAPGVVHMLLNSLPSVKTLSVRRFVSTLVRVWHLGRLQREGCPIIELDQNHSLMPQLETIILDCEGEGLSDLPQLLHTVLTGEEQSRYFENLTGEARVSERASIAAFTPHPHGWLKRVLLVSNDRQKTEEYASEILDGVGVEGRFKVAGVWAADFPRGLWDRQASMLGSIEV